MSNSAKYMNYRLNRQLAHAVNDFKDRTIASFTKKPAEKKSTTGDSLKKSDGTGGSNDSGVVAPADKKVSPFAGLKLKNKTNIFSHLGTRKDKKKGGILSTALLGIAHDQEKEVKSVYIDVSDKTHLAITSTFHRNTRPTDFTIRTIKLATLLSRYSPTLFSKMFQKFLPEILCLKMIQDDTLSHVFRSCLTDFYIAGYLEGKCINLEKTLNNPSEKQLKSKTGRLRIKEDDFEEKYIRVNEELRVGVIMGMTQNLDLDNEEGEMTNPPKKNLIKFLFDYLNNPENYLKLQPQLLESLLNLLNFFLDRGFLIVEDIAHARLALFNFLKFFLAGRFKEKLKSLTQLLLQKTMIGKSSKVVDDDGEEKEEVVEEEKKIQPRYLPFISKMLDCLKRLENTIFDLGFEYLVHQEDSLKLFEHEDINKSFNTR